MPTNSNPRTSIRQFGSNHGSDLSITVYAQEDRRCAIARRPSESH